MQAEPLNAELRIQVVEDTVLLRHSSGAEQSGSLADGWQEGTLRADTLALLHRWVQANKVSDRRELEVFGRQLYDLLFDDRTGSFLLNHLRAVQEAPDARLRLLLDFTRAPAGLTNLPWEYLYVHSRTARSFFLATDPALALARYLPLEQGRRPLVSKENRLRLLVAIAQPAALQPVIPDRVLDAVRKLSEQSPVDLDFLEATTLTGFEDRLADFRPHVVHFLGHGQYDAQNRQGQVALIGNDERSVRAVSDADFAEIFTHAHVPRLVILHMCEGGTVDREGGFSGLAPRLFLAGVPAVVAMQHIITNLAASAFSQAFYRQLVQGHPIDQAVQAGRYRMTRELPSAENSRVFGTPVLYLHSSDGVILPA